VEWGWGGVGGVGCRRGVVPVVDKYIRTLDVPVEEVV